MVSAFENFTEKTYRELLRLAKANWASIFFDDYRQAGRVCLWRHDVDISVHRAYKLALIEKEEGIFSTYFIHLHSKFYNALEDEVAGKIVELLHLGHQLGLHFDLGFYDFLPDKTKDVEFLLEQEQRMMQTVFQTKISSFSLHNPRPEDLKNLRPGMISGMVNANSEYIRENYSYCSDSNGYWRFQDLGDLLADAADEKIHILTHPEMWTPEPMSPRARVARCIDGRAARQAQWYDDTLAKAGRENIR